MLAVIAILGSASGRAAGPAEGRKVALGESFTLRVGESALVEAEALRIGFQAVSTDSRCPKGENCVWEGDAIVRIWVQRDSGGKKVRELHTSKREAGAADFEGWSINLVALDPYPVAGRTISEADYVATLRVTRGSSPGGEIRQQPTGTGAPEATERGAMPGSSPVSVGLVALVDHQVVDVPAEQPAAAVGP